MNACVRIPWNIIIIYSGEQLYVLDGHLQAPPFLLRLLIDLGPSVTAILKSAVMEIEVCVFLLRNIHRELTERNLNPRSGAREEIRSGWVRRTVFKGLTDEKWDSVASSLDGLLDTLPLNHFPSAWICVIDSPHHALHGVLAEVMEFDPWSGCFHVRIRHNDLKPA